MTMFMMPVPTEMAGKCTRCKKGTKEEPATTVVIDVFVDILCNPCVEELDFTGWTFDPLLNLYTRS